MILEIFETVRILHCDSIHMMFLLADESDSAKGNMHAGVNMGLRSMKVDLRNTDSFPQF